MRAGVGSRFEGMTWGLGGGETGLRARLVGACAPDWIPAYAGMTGQGRG